FLEDRNDICSEELPDEKEPHHRPIFVAIADKQSAVIFEMRKRSNQLRFRSTFEAKTKGPACLQNFLDHFVELIHFNGINADISIPIFGFFDGLAKSGIQLGHARAEKILKTDEQRKLDPLLPQILHNSKHIDADRICENRPHRKMSFVVDIKIGLAP